MTYPSRALCLSPTDTAYLAGIVDGEGTITISKLSRLRGAFYPVVSISNTKQILIDWCSARIPGGVYVKGRENVRWRTAHQIVWNGWKALEIVKLLEPFLVIKQNQARLIIDLATDHYRALDEVGAHNKFSYRRPPPEWLLEKRAVAYHAMRELNRRGAIANA